MRQRSRRQHLSSLSQAHLSPFLDSILSPCATVHNTHINSRVVTSIARNLCQRSGIEYDQELRDVKAPPGRLGDETHRELIRRLVNANQDFHHTVMAASGNRRLEKLVRRTVQLPMVLKAFSWYMPSERAVTNHQHRKIVRVIESGDAVRAELVMTEHIYEGRIGP